MVGVEAADQLAPVGLLLLLELGPAGGGQQQGQEGRGSPAAPHHWCGRVGGTLAPAGLVRQDTTPAPHALLHYKPPCHSPGRLYSPPPLSARGGQLISQQFLAPDIIRGDSLGFKSE